MLCKRTMRASKRIPVGLAAVACTACIGAPPPPAPPPTTDDEPPLLSSEACAERVVPIAPDAAVPAERARLNVGYEGDHLLDLNIGGCLFTAPVSDRWWSLEPGYYTVIFRFETKGKRRAKILMSAGGTKMVLVQADLGP